jgi:hypothetical protein
LLDHVEFSFDAWDGRLTQTSQPLSCGKIRRNLAATEEADLKALFVRSIGLVGQEPYERGRGLFLRLARYVAWQQQDG